MSDTVKPPKPFVDDLERWAAERGGPGEPPTAEELIALRDGTLTDSAAERVREWIALDPDWAVVWRDLHDFGSWAESDETPRAEVDDAWRAVASRLPDTVAEAPTAEPRAWTWSPAWGLAAMLVLAAAAWFVVSPSSTVDETRWARIDLPADARRAGMDVTFGAEHEGIEVVVPAEAVSTASRIEVRAGGTGAMLATRSLASGDEPTLRVDRSALVDGGVVVVRALDAEGAAVYRYSLRVHFGS